VSDVKVSESSLRNNSGTWDEKSSVTCKLVHTTKFLPIGLACTNERIFHGWRICLAICTCAHPHASQTSRYMYGYLKEIDSDIQKHSAISSSLQSVLNSLQKPIQGPSFCAAWEYLYQVHLKIVVATF